MDSNTLFTGLEHIGIKANDLESSIKFYQGVLGFQLIQRIKPGDVELAFLKLGDMVIELVETKEGQVYTDGVVNHLALKVSNIFLAVEHLKQHQVQFISAKPMEIAAGRYNFFFRGPGGEKLELFHG